jgi:predicted ATPase
MVDSLSFRNFKCFEDLRLSIKPLTLLTGFNGGGKSTSIQPLLLLTQGLRGNWSADSFALNGPLVRLGSAGDVLPRGASENRIVVQVSSGDEDAEWQLEARSGVRELAIVDGRSTKRGRKDVSWTELVAPAGVRSSALVSSISRLSYLSAVRTGPSDAFPYPDTDRTAPNVGVLGEFAPFWLDRSVDNELDAALLNASEPATSIRKQLDAFLADLFPGAQANVVAVPHASALTVQFRLGDESGWQRPANIGYGLIYAFPILVALLTSVPGQIIVIDSPEAHLHPSAQSRMGRILAKFAAGGRQIIVETHSDHLLNGCRLAVADQAILSDDVAIHFFAGAQSGGVTSPVINKDGEIDAWPSGFFDQSEKDLAQLAGWG